MESNHVVYKEICQTPESSASSTYIKLENLVYEDEDVEKKDERIVYYNNTAMYRFQDSTDDDSKVDTDSNEQVLYLNRDTFVRNAQKGNEMMAIVYSDDIPSNNDDVLVIDTNAYQSQDDLKLKCVICNKMLSTPGALCRHFRSHSGDKPFECELCSKRFSQQSNLWKHILVHTGERQFSCKYCDKTFSQRANMQKHIMVHTGLKPYECIYCQKTFTQKANLTKHLRVHTGDKPFICTICNRTFAQKSNMAKHRKVHQGKNNYNCLVCREAFKLDSDLTEHMASHATMFGCEACGIMYESQETLLQHLDVCSAIEQSVKIKDKNIKK